MIFVVYCLVYQGLYCKNCDLGSHSNISSVRPTVAGKDRYSLRKHWNSLALHGYKFKKLDAKVETVNFFIAIKIFVSHVSSKREISIYRNMYLRQRRDCSLHYSSYIGRGIEVSWSVSIGEYY
jgi:hypothetical protein